MSHPTLCDPALSIASYGHGRNLSCALHLYPYSIPTTPDTNRAGATPHGFLLPAVFFHSNLCGIIVADGHTTGTTKFEIVYQGNNQSQANAGNGPWVYYNTGGTNRATIDNINFNGNEITFLPGNFHLYIQPMIRDRDVTWFGEGHVREITFLLRNNNGHCEVSNDLLDTVTATSDTSS